MADNNNKDQKNEHHINFLFWIHLIRALLAFTLGIRPIFIPELI